MRGVVFPLAILMLLTGCSNSDDPGDLIGDPNNIGFFRVVNAIGDSPSTAIRVDDGVGGSIAFGQATILSQLPAGVEYEIDVSYTTPQGEEILVIEDQRISITRDVTSNLIVFGTLDGPQVLVFDQAEPNVAEDDDTGELQFLHVSFTAQDSLDVHLTQGDEELTAASVQSTLSYQEFSDLIKVPSVDDYRLRITEAGTTTVIWDSGEFRVVQSSRTLILVLDYFGPGDNKLRAVQINANGAFDFINETLPSAFRFYNMLADTGPVDFHFGDTADPALFSNLAFGEVSDYVDLDRGGRSVNITPTGVTDRFVFESSLIIPGGVFSTLLVAGSDQTLSGRLLIDDNRRLSSEIQMRFMNASLNANPVDIYLLDPGEEIADTIEDFSSIPFLGVSNIPIAPGSYDVLATDPVDFEELLAPQRIDVEANGIYTIILTDSAGGGESLQLILADDFLD